MKGKYHGFTLIELLIVVAIIAILAAIAVPNFMNARLRATIARMESDMKAIGDALFMYRIDNKCYFNNMGSNPHQELRRLTSPLPYIAAIPQDPFRRPNAIYYSTTSNYDYTAFGPEKCKTDWVLHGIGPDTDEDIWGAAVNPQATGDFRRMLYNMSNGLKSSGDVIHASWFTLSF